MLLNDLDRALPALDLVGVQLPEIEHSAVQSSDVGLAGYFHKANSRHAPYHSCDERDASKTLRHFASSPKLWEETRSVHRPLLHN
jgi:hypothetical protein